MMHKSLAVIGGLGLSAGLMYLLAPERARRWGAMLLNQKAGGGTARRSRRKPTAKRAIRSARHRRTAKA